MVARTNPRFYLIQWLLSGSSLQSEERRTLRRAIGSCAITVLLSILLGACLLSTVGLMVLAANPTLGPWLLDQNWFQAAQQLWQNSWPGQFFEWVLP